MGEHAYKGGTCPSCDCFVLSGTPMVPDIGGTCGDKEYEGIPVLVPDIGGTCEGDDMNDDDDDLRCCCCDDNDDDD